MCRPFLADFRILDPACGSGNFLFLALKALKDVEHQVNLDAEELGLERQIPVTGPRNVLGIEVNEYAAELARATIWIGELQWRKQNGYGWNERPVLEPLEQIECRDAVLTREGKEAAWPSAEAVVGNPPFVGDKKMRSELGNAYTEALRAAYSGRVPGSADLVCFWFERARTEIAAGRAKRVGFVSTNTIRQGANRQVLQRVLSLTRIFAAWPDEPWVNDGADVRVSLVAFGTSAQATALADQPVSEIYSDLRGAAPTGGGLDLTAAAPLCENDGTCFFGLSLAGPFVVEPDIARAWLRSPNPNQRSNADVLAPIRNGSDITGRAGDRWVVDFGPGRSEAESSLYEAPFGHVVRRVKPVRKENNRPSRAKHWWLHGEARPGMRRAGTGLARWIVTSETAKHRCFVWLPRGVVPEHKLVVVVRSDDATFGVLNSRIHTAWAVTTGGRLGVGNDPVYSTSKCFLPFPFPPGLSPAETKHQRVEAVASGALIPADLPNPLCQHAKIIAEAACHLNKLRELWLNPPEWTERVAEVVPLAMNRSPYPDRIVVKAGFEKDLAKRTLTSLYNERPHWLARAHEELDAAVAAAYGWADYSASMPEEELLRRLLVENRQRVARQTGAQTEIPLVGLLKGYATGGTGGGRKR